MSPNLHIRVEDPVKGVVEERLYHNVFTAVGRTWLRDLCRFSSISAPDSVVTNNRIRWVIGGTTYKQGTSFVKELSNPQTFDGSNYLKEVGVPTFSPITFNRYSITYPGTEFASVDLKEFGLVVDDGSLDPTLSSVQVVAYRSFQTPVVKLSGQTLTLDWEIRF